MEFRRRGGVVWLETIMLVRALGMVLLLALIAPVATTAHGGEATGKGVSPAATEVVAKLIATSLDVQRVPARGGIGMRRGPWNARNGASDAGGGPAAGFVILTPPDGGAPVRLVVADDLRRKLASLAPLRGELVNVRVQTDVTDGGSLASAIVAFDGPRVLQRRRVYVFEGVTRQKENGHTTVTVRLSKFGQSREAQVPNHPPATGGAAAPDALIVERIGAFSTGELVEVELAGSAENRLVDIDTPRDPRVAEFVKQTSVKDAFDKSWPAVVLAVDGKEETFLLPAARSGVPVSPTTRAMTALARRIEPGFPVRFTERPVADQTMPATLRTLTLDGDIEPRSDQRLEVVGSYLRVEIWEDGRGRDANVSYRPGSTRLADQCLGRGAARVVASDAEISRLNLDAEKARQISAVLDQLERSPGAQPTTQERSHWAEAYGAWMSARDPNARERIEADMLWAGQELSGRWRKEYASRYALIRSLLDSTQLDEVMRLGREAQAAGGRF
jgi:hypothetical protein